MRQHDDTAARGVQAIRAFQDNYIWLIRHGDRAVVVDPGQAEPVLEVLQRDGLVLDAILLTHHHADHVGGVLALREQAPAVTVYGPAAETLPHCDVRLKEGDIVHLPALELELRVLDVPGHTAGHIAYHGAAAGAGPLLFCGDTLFATGCGRVFEGTPAQMHASLAKLVALPPDTQVYCAHEYTASNVRWAMAVEPGNAQLQAWSDTVQQRRAADESTVPTRLAQELAVNPFLRTAEPAVIAAAANHVGRPLTEPAEVFGALRAWKDGFR